MKSLPISIIKIDGLFIRNMVSDQIDFSMVKSIHDLAHTMGKCTIAEFAETEAIHQLVTSIAIDFSQGFPVHEPEALHRLTS